MLSADYGIGYVNGSFSHFANPVTENLVRRFLACSVIEESRRANGSSRNDYRIQMACLNANLSFLNHQPLLCIFRNNLINMLWSHKGKLLHNFWHQLIQFDPPVLIRSKPVSGLFRTEKHY